MYRDRIVVVIPIYKAEPSKYELISFEQCLKVLSSYDICLISGSDEVVNYYIGLIDKWRYKVRVFSRCFDARYFQSIKGYNELLLSSRFYGYFRCYEYMLVYQLDCFVFSSDLSFWTSRQYDYVGAPWSDLSRSRDLYYSLVSSKYPLVRWLKKKIDFNKGRKIYVGNGGFSLRKVKTFRNISNWLRILEPNLLKYDLNEDLVWAVVATKYFKSFKVANPDEALYFSFETEPRKAYKKNKGRLPFGCHAWSRYDLVFWRELIEKAGFRLP